MVAGYTDTYVRVHAAGERNLTGQMVPVHVSEITRDGDAIGKIATQGANE